MRIQEMTDNELREAIAEQKARIEHAQEQIRKAENELTHLQVEQLYRNCKKNPAIDDRTIDSLAGAR